MVRVQLVAQQPRQVVETRELIELVELRLIAQPRRVELAYQLCDVAKNRGVEARARDLLMPCMEACARALLSTACTRAALSRACTRRARADVMGTYAELVCLA